LPEGTDRHALAEFVLTVMEGAVMQARTYRDVGPFDRSVAQLRSYFHSLEREACEA
jgi:TetR/AcrR family transcriptional regulator, transcriptional repressor for nem operon